MATRRALSTDQSCLLVLPTRFSKRCCLHLRRAGQQNRTIVSRSRAEQPSSTRWPACGKVARRRSTGHEKYVYGSSRQKKFTSVLPIKSRHRSEKRVSSVTRSAV